MISPTAIAQVAIIGQGYTPALAALFLLKKWGPQAPRITLINCGESADPPIITCASSFKSFHAELGISEKEWVQSSGAAFHLGTLYEYANAAWPAFFMCEAPYGLSLQGVRFHHWFTRFVGNDSAQCLDDYCLNALLAKAARFAPSSTQKNSIFSNVVYGYRFVTKKYCDFLHAKLPTQVSVKNSTLSAVHAGEAGIEKILLANGEAINADLFIDCTQEHMLKRHLNGNKIPTIPAHEWQISATQNGFGAPYSWLTIADHTLHLRTQLHGAEYKLTIPCDSDAPPYGQGDTTPWQKNCLSLGPAIQTRAPLLIDPIHLTGSALYRLYHLWPTTSNFHLSALQYNENARDEWARIEESDSIHYWAACQKNAKCLAPGAKHKMDIFASEGRLPPYESETMAEDQWAALMFALGVFPQASDPLIEGVDAKWAQGEIAKLRESLQQAVNRAPPHDEFYQKEVLGKL